MSKRAHENGDRFDDEEAGSLWTLKTVRHAGAAGWWYCYRLSRSLARSPELAAARGIATAARSTKGTMTGSAAIAVTVMVATGVTGKVVSTAPVVKGSIR